MAAHRQPVHRVFQSRPSIRHRRATEANDWVHELCDVKGETLVHMLFPTDQLKTLCRRAYINGDHRENVGDDGLSHVVLLSLAKLGDLAGSS